MSQEMFNVFGDEEEVGKELPLVAPQNPEQIDECNKASPSSESFFSSKRLTLFTDDEKANQLPGSCSTPSLLRNLQSPGLSGPEFTRDNHFSKRTYVDKKTKGTIKLIISNLNGLKTKVTSSFHTIANLPWRLAAKTENSKRTNNTRFFSIYIDCNPASESNVWLAEAIVEFRLIAQKPCGSDFTRHFQNSFNYNSNNWGFPSFIEFSEIINPEKGFIKGDKVVIEAHITVNKVVGVSQALVFDFLSSSNLSDGILVVEGTRLYISKQYLALYSPVFEAMFYSDFVEKERKEIPIEDVILEEFVELLNVVYPSHKNVTAENVEYLLELADKYQIQFVMEQCEKFLQTTDEINCINKLFWADTYALSNLHDACIRSLTSPEDVKALKATDEYRNLSDTSRAALLEKVLKML